MSWLDILVFLIVGYSMFAGFRSGFVRVGIGFAATILGIVFGFWYYGVAGEHLTIVSSPRVAKLLGFVLVFLAFVLAGALVGRLLVKIFRLVGLSWLDRLLGTAFGFVRGAVVTVALVTVILAFAPTPPPPSIVASKTLPYVIGTSSLLTAITPYEVKDKFQEAKEKIKKMWLEQVQEKASSNARNKVLRGVPQRPGI